jgi:hypothetical protein
MKIALFAILFFISLQSFAKELQCKSSAKFEGWDSGNTHDFVYLTASVSGSALVDPVATGAYQADFRGELGWLLSPNRSWLRYKTLEDAWCWYTVTLPLGFQAKSKGERFIGFIDRLCEDQSGQESIRLSCSLR